MFGKYRHRIHGKAKSRIRKGFSSESNPAKRRHREAAAAARAGSASAESMLAVDDRLQAEHLLQDLGGMNISHENSESVVSEGAVSRISRFTTCTNSNFDVVHRVWKSGSNMQKEVVSVLAAMAELIRERNGSETDEEYFAALMTTLECTPLSEPSRMGAVAFLLQLIIRKIPKAVLQEQFTVVVQVLYIKVQEFSKSTDGSDLKYLLSVLGVVLRAQPACVWNTAITRKVIVSVAALCAHDRPWVRTMARRVVRTVLTDPVTAMEDGLHAASTSVGTFVQQQLHAASNTRNGEITAMRYLCLLEGIMHKMPANLFKQLAEKILSTIAVANSMMKCSALQCLSRCMQRQPCDAALSVDTNVLLVKALKQLSPLSEDSTVCAYWMQALAEVHVCLMAKDPSRCFSLLPSTLEVVVKFFDTNDEQLAQITYQILARIIERCVQDNEDCAKRLLTLLDQALNVKSTSVWKHVLRAQMRLYETAGSGIIGEEFEKALKTLALLRESDECFCKQELDFAVGCAVRHVGVPSVLSALPLNIDADAAILSTEFPRSWLIPVLRVNLHNAPLAYFSSHILPLAMKIHRRLGSLDPVPQRLYMTLQAQLWELLPSFCSSPCDLESCFPQLAPVLGAALKERDDLRPQILSALRRVLQFVLLPDATLERVEVVSTYAKNFMPLLFNIYTANIGNDLGDKCVRMSVLETIRMYAEVTPKHLLAQFVDAAINKANGAFEDRPKQGRILDILCAIARSGDCSTLDQVMVTVKPWFGLDGLQKKAFRLLEEILSKRASPELEQFFVSRSTDFENVLLRPIVTVNLPARAAFCSSIQMYMESLINFPRLSEFCLNTLDAIVLCLDKANNTHTRSNASICLQRMMKKLIEVGADNDQQVSTVMSGILSRIYELATPVSGSDNGSIQLEVARSTLVALNIVAQKLIRMLNAEHVSRLVTHGCSWIGDGRPAVRILVIRLLRVLVQKLPEFAIQQYRDLIISSIFDGQLTCDVTSKVRRANRLLLEVLVAKFGVDALLKYTTKPEWIKQMRNIEKRSRRKERHAKGGGTTKDSDDESISDVGSRLTSKTAGADTILKLLEDSDASESDSEGNSANVQTRRGGVWLKDDANMDESTDLLDNKSIIHKITTSDPSQLAKRKAKLMERKKSKESGFKIRKDGKLVILDSDDDDGDQQRKRRKRCIELEDMDDDFLFENKKKKDDNEMGSDSEDDDILKSRSSIQSKGGKTPGLRSGEQGIHRDSLKGVKGRPFKGKGKNEKRNQKLQPYAYVPLRQRGIKQDLLKALKSQHKARGTKKLKKL